MPKPRLLHPINVTLHIMDRDDSVYDPYAREPVGQVIREGESTGSGTAVTFKAQVSFYYAGAIQKGPVYDRAGVEEETNMYIATTYKRLVKAGLVTLDSNGDFESFQIKRGDRLVKVGKEKCDLYITGMKPFGHYPRTQQNLVQFNLEDRNPANQRDYADM